MREYNEMKMKKLQEEQIKNATKQRIAYDMSGPKILCPFKIICPEGDESPTTILRRMK